jgi:hypothetical protein
LVLAGALLAAVGALAWAGWLGWLGRLPGDLRIASGGTRIFIPITSMLLVSLVISLIVAAFRRR